MLTQLLAEADAAGELDWTLSVDSTVVRAHQHGATAQRSGDEPDATDTAVDREDVGKLPAQTRGPVEL